MKKIVQYVGVLTLIVGVIGAGLAATAKADLPRNWGTNPIIDGGATTADELKQKYTEDKTKDLGAIYDAYGLNAAAVTTAGTSAKMSEVRKDGTVVVNGQVVATDALSIGRDNIGTNTKKVIAGKTFYERPPSTSFKSNAIVAFVFFDANGQFRAAILTSCGNPVSAKPVPVPPKKTPPTYTCDSLTAKQIVNRKYTFTTNATATGDAAIASYSYDFGDGKTLTTSEKTVSYEYAQAGTYLATVTVNVKVGQETKSVTGPQCQAQIKPTTPPEMCPTNPQLPKNDERCVPCDIRGKEHLPKDSPDCEVPPVTPPATPPTLPQTGPADVFVGALGVGALFIAGYYWLGSRRELMAAFLNR